MRSSRSSPSDALAGCLVIGIAFIILVVIAVLAIGGALRLVLG